MKLPRLRQFLTDSWYPIFLVSALVAPAIVCQTVAPLVPYGVWETLGESAYAAILSFQRPNVTEPSRVMLVEIDQRTLDAYGWPIAHDYYVALLQKLEASGRPWVLSLLRLQGLDKAKQNSAKKTALAAADRALAAGIKRYGRYVGSGLEFEAGAELTPNEEETLLPRIALAKGGVLPTQFPYLPMNLVEDDRFVEAERAFGFGTRFGLSPIVRCMQFYATDAAHTGSILIPSSLAWVSAFANSANITTQTGAGWPRKGEKAEFATKTTLRLGYKHCLTSPAVPTRTFLDARRIERVSLVDLLDKKQTFALKDKVVLLARDDMHLFRGTGDATVNDDGVVEEDRLAARFLDGLLTGQTIRREDLSHLKFMAWLPLAVAGALAATALSVGLGGVIAVAGIMLASLVAVAGYNLARGDYLMPLESMASVVFSMALLGSLFLAVRFQTMRRQIRLAANLRKSLSQANTLASIESGTLGVWRSEFPKGHVRFGGFDRDLYEAASDPKALMRVIGHRKTGLPRALTAKPTGLDLPTMPKTLNTFWRNRFMARSKTMTIEVDSAAGHLGTLSIACTYRGHELAAVSNLANAVALEVAEHWHRIKLLSDQKLLDYKVLAEQTRVDIFERFLTKVLVAKFSDDATMEENLRSVLTPRATRAALLQADIRGYSRVSATMAPLEMVRLLQNYFRDTVDAAQHVAQVKLIGDCIFLFIEESTGRPSASPADLALELAGILARETRKQNALRAATGGEPLNFGIAIHYGDVVVGNLSSDSCIDYTVISPNVNLVARLEEMTKNEQIAAAIGKNGVIMSGDAIAALVRHRGQAFKTMALKDFGVHVRSFTDVETVFGLNAEDAEKLCPQVPIVAA